MGSQSVLHDWSWNFNTLITCCEELTHLKRPWCWERLKAGGEGNDRGWDGWMASLTQWTWVWVNSESWWWTGKPDVPSPWGHKQLDITERLNWTELKQVCRQRKGSIKGRNQICRKETELSSEHSPLESKKKWTDTFQVKSWLLDWKKGCANTS